MKSAKSTETLPGTTAIACKMCRQPFANEDLRVDLGLAFCRTCSTVRDLPARQAPGDPLPDGSAPAPARRARPAVPAHFELNEQPGRRTIRWRVPVAGPLWGLIFVLVLPFALWRLQGSELLVAPWLLITCGLLYLTFATLKNHTSVTVADGTVRVSHGPWPIPWRSDREFHRANVRQLFSRRYLAGRGRSYYGVGVQLADQREETLVAGLSQPEQALFLEQYLESLLDIVDAPVKGELPR